MTAMPPPFTLQRTRPRALRIVPLVLALAISQAYAATPVGQNGTAGTHGATPGAAGTNGGNGGNGTATVVNGAAIEAYGGNGGAGGNGADGAVSGAAGSGGNGGYAISTTVVSSPAFASDVARAIGGDGGEAGLPGKSTGTPGAQGMSGNGGDATLVYEATGADALDLSVWTGGGAAGGTTAGHDIAGHGGSARATLTLDTANRAAIDANVYGGNGYEWFARAAAAGGAGGDAMLETAVTSAQVSLTGKVRGGRGNNAQGGPGTSAGNGGTATARLAGSATDSLTTRLTLEGGVGGAGTNGANGGHGGDTVLDMPFDVSATSGPIDVQISSVAGNGGSAYNGLAGRAGSATTSLVLDARRATSVKVEVTGRGGDGGSVSGALDSLSLSVPTEGGTARTDLQVTAAGPVQLAARADAGAAGDRYLPSGRMNGVNGANAAASIVATTDTVQDSSVYASASGGAGGGARGTGNVGGKGGTGVASVAATNAGNGYLAVQAASYGGVGGTGYEGARAGDGGDAVLVNAISGSTSGTLWLSQRASAGNGGFTNDELGSGGSAVSRLTLTDGRSTEIKAEVYARGGGAKDQYNGTNRPGTGNAEAVLVLESTRAATPVNGTSIASIASGAYRGQGNSAVARSTVTARGMAQSTAQASATYGGYLDAFARARSAAAATATATAKSASYTGIARSRAEADSTGGTATVNAVASGADAQSIAVARGQGGTASAQSESASPGDVRGRASASAMVQGETVVRADTNSNGVMHAVGQPALTNGAGSSLAVLPAAATVAAALEAAPNVAAAFGTRKMFGVGLMESASANAGTYTYVTSATFDIDYYYRDLELGLFDASTTGSGLQSLTFTVSDLGTQVFSRSFASGAEAVAFFDDHAFRLPMLPDTRYNDHQLTLSTSFTYSGPGAFSFGYALGVSAVPEPQTWLLMLGGLAVVVAGRRRLR